MVSRPKGGRDDRVCVAQIGAAHGLKGKVRLRSFTQEPTDHFYGTDMGVRDPFGNPIRILQQGKAAQGAKA